ncbi:DNA-binding MarR family transcriptional regulator [Kibdelosporangium banguiense]|uniref:DNA-binding MarR family transcriptional regulator n=1 Tax=Kibdelosporangium banguiense TaxID=1365924 RepID=A0ABS4TQW5_9PSEU|nr:MarR family winged helix-turn-helix transcriptional regulator [Kibdelosporangium banguiense]MBP2326802.1 DNA-binding MarR family transcriptional regulator [Kibdelosporangium banguiense]
MTDQRLYFMLQRSAHHLRIAADRRCMAAAGVTTAQLGALFVIQDQPGVTQQDLAAVLGQRESAITAMVSRLVEAGLITKRAHPRQYRASALELTAAGTKALHLVRPAIDSFNADMRAVIGPDEFEITANALRKLADWQS